VLAAMVPVFYAFSLFFTLVLGLPVFLLLRRLSLVRWWSALAAGIAIGAIVASLVQGSTFLSVEVAGFGAALGAGEAMLFWFVWLSSRPKERRLGL